MLKIKRATGELKSFFGSRTAAGGTYRISQTSRVLVTPPGSVSFVYAGETTQTWTVPPGVTTIDVRVWGAGGGEMDRPIGLSATTSRGGTGGFTCATVAVTPGETLYVVVGNGGKKTTRLVSVAGLGGWPGGGTGSLGTYTSDPGGGGGGYTGLFSAGGVSHSNAIVVAAGGGGGGGGPISSPNGFAGGGLVGNGRTAADAANTGIGTSNSAIGGSQTSGGGGASGGAVSGHGISGSALQGGNANGTGLYGAGGGGGGYYGGGGGDSNGTPGAGGSGYYGGINVITGTTFVGKRSTGGTPTIGPLPPFNSDPVYIEATGSYGKIGLGSYGTGAAVSPSITDGMPGFIHIKWPGGQGFYDGHFDRPIPVTPGVSSISTFNADVTCRKSGTPSPGPGDYIRCFTFSVEPNKTVDVYVGPSSDNTCLAVFTGSLGSDFTAGKLIGSNTSSLGSDAYMTWDARVTFNTTGAPTTRQYVVHAGPEISNTSLYDLKFRVIVT